MPDPSELHDEFQNFAGKLRKSAHGTHRIDLSGKPMDPRVAEAAWIFNEEEERLKAQRRAERRLVR